MVNKFMVVSRIALIAVSVYGIYSICELLKPQMDDQCIEMEQKRDEAMHRGDWDTTWEFSHKYRALLDLINSQGEGMFVTYFLRRYGKREEVAQ